MKSRWANDEEDAAIDAQRKQEKEEKKRAKAEKQRKIEEAEDRRREEALRRRVLDNNGNGGTDGRPTKRRRLSDEGERDESSSVIKLLRFPAPEWGPCRHVDNFEKLNHIEEGSYGWVSRAKESATGEIVALKKLKMDNASDGFPVTGLREIQTLMESRHPNIVNLREVVMGETFDEVFLVMDFLEHDLKTLQEDMAEPFFPSEIKTLLQQLVSATEHLHNNWIVHRDLKTSNLLMNNRGQIKIADFGMARYFGDPPPKMTQLVVTLWYRAPELLLGAETYGKEVDLWSIGCIFGELLTRQPLLQDFRALRHPHRRDLARFQAPPQRQTTPSPSQPSKVSPLARTSRATQEHILLLLPFIQAQLTTGPPNTPVQSILDRNPKLIIIGSPSTQSPPPNHLRTKFPLLTTSGNNLLSSLLSLNPTARPTATQVLAHPYFREDPKPKAAAMFPTFPSKAGQEKRRRRYASPSAPKRGDAPPIAGAGAGAGAQLDFSGIFAGREAEEAGAGFALKLG
ncbi:MAG: hypothetical protein M1837_005705 [Sclerophora amabilis]|nr:MAG: hypothetical protein M1837_005705 [Sclerophora amabilis]